MHIKDMIQFYFRHPITLEGFFVRDKITQSSTSDFPDILRLWQKKLHLSPINKTSWQGQNILKTVRSGATLLGIMKPFMTALSVRSMEMCHVGLSLVQPPAITDRAVVRPVVPAVASTLLKFISFGLA